ncbi:MAG: hypothetical protein FJ135_03010 [Deltaproteobacteria bacterium]|nr:hypothetical protein [Deltaproteobacteria bacterium]
MDTIEIIRQALQCGQPGCECGKPKGHVHCPAHQDHTPYLSVSKKNGKLLVKCFGGCEQAQVVAALKDRNLWPHGNNGRPRPRVDAKPKGRIIATYDYRDEKGHLLFQVCRLQPKSFRQRRPDGSGGWMWNTDGVRRVPYRLPELLGADPAVLVCIVEGEGDADGLAARGLVVTTNPGGAGKGKWREEFNEFFRGRLVVILPDNDKAGHQHAQDIAHNLRRIAASVKILNLPELPEKGDVSDWLRAGGTKEQLSALADAAPEWQGPARETEQEDHPYSVRKDAIVYKKLTRHGPIITPICNFNAAIVGEQVRDDGMERQVCLTLEGRLAEGRPLPKVEVPASQFLGMNWVTSAWGSKAIIYAGFGTRDHLRAAIQLLSGEVPTKTVFTHTGWRHIDGEWLYLHGGGAIGAQGPVDGTSVVLEGRLSHLVLPPPPTGEGLKAAVRASWALLKLAPPTITAPLLAATYRAPLGECIALDLSLFFSGQTGSQKTELTVLGQAHFGADFNRSNLPDSWASTANALEKLAFLAKDAVLIVDDFCPRGGPADVSRLHAAADRVFRGAANRAGRGRLAPDGSLKLPYAPRAFIISSGEDIPTGYSLRARLFIVEVKRGDVDLPSLSRAQVDAAQGLCAQSLAAYIQWLVPRMDMLKTTLPQRARGLREEIRGEPWAHDKTPDNLASLLLGLETFWSFAIEVGALSQDEDGELYAKAWEALFETARAQAGHQEAEDPTGRFLSLLASALISGRAHLADAHTGGWPEDAGSWGWKGSEPQGGLVGWLDGANLLLEPDAAFAMAQRLAREQGGGLAITPRTLWRRMADRGLLASREVGRNLRYWTIQNRRPRVLHLLVETFHQEIILP